MSDLSGRLPNLRFGVAQLRDYGSSPVWQVEQGLAFDQAAVQAAIDSLSADEGGDSPEAYGTGLFQSRNDSAVGWANGAKHLVVLIADDVPHDDDLNAGVPPEVINQPSPWDTGTDPGPGGAGIDWQQELADFKDAEYTLAFVLYHGHPAYLPYWDWWARLTGGQATESTSATPLGDVLVDIVTETASTCRSDVEDDPPQCDADEAPAFSGELGSLPDTPDPVDSSSPDAPNEGVVAGTCLPGPDTTSDQQDGLDGIQPDSVTARAAPPPDEWNCHHIEGAPPAVPAVTWSENPTAIRFRNADGVWTIYKRCFDATVDGRRHTVGPGYIARLERNGVSIVDDYRGRTDTWTPGYLNAVNGGLGTFGWHHARGAVNQTPAGDDPTTPSVEVGIGRTPQVVEGRMCAAANGGYGVYARNWYGPVRVSPTKINYTIDVWLRDQYGDTGEGPSEHAITRVRYRYTFYRSSVSLWALVTTYAAPNAAGTPFVKEPKFTALTRGGGFVRMAVFNGTTGRSFSKSVALGEPEGTAVLHTDHAPDDARKRVRWDFEPKTGEEGSPRCTESRPCLNVVARSFPVTSAAAGILRTEQAANWEGGGLGLDRWAAASAGRARAYPRDTRGDASLSLCKTPPRDSDDLNGDRKVDDFETSKASERAAPDMDQVREWELGGWKSGPDTNPYQAALTLFPGWENGRGGWDCEPLQRSFGSTGESWGSYFSYSLNDGWLMSG
jgi:hypothetical protein